MKNKTNDNKQETIEKYRNEVVFKPYVDSDTFYYPLKDCRGVIYLLLLVTHTSVTQR